jgi:hypothetical protein
MVFPRNPHSFNLSQAIITRSLFPFSHLLRKEREVSKAVEDNLIHVIKLRIRLYSIYYPSLHANYYFAFYDVDFFNEAIRQ